MDFLNSQESYRRETLRAYKRIFSGTIKESFLIEMVNKVETDPRYPIIFLKSNNFRELLSIDAILTDKGPSSLSICKMIVMSHYANTVSLPDDLRGKQQESSTYKEKLTNDVINMFLIEKLAASDFSNSALESYLPIIYYTSALTNYLGNKYDEIVGNKIIAKTPYDTDFNNRMIYKLLIKFKAIISLANIAATDELMIVYRSLIELFMTYSALWDQNDSTIKDFYEFDKATFDYNYCGKIPKSYKNAAKDLGANEISYLNYGWIKNLEQYKNFSKKKNPFSIGIFAKILDVKCGYFCPNFGSELYKFYKACNPQIHGTMLVMNYFQLELHIFQNIAVMLKFIANIMSESLFSFDFKYNNLDLIDELNKVLNDSKNVYSWLGESETNLNKTNLDYRNRFICSMRMKK